jgi:hypothetical protein
MVEIELGKRIIAVRDKVVSHFDANNWDEIGLLTGYSKVINEHPRLLRSLSWGDEDYAGNALDIIHTIAEKDKKAFSIFEQYVAEKFPEQGEFISAKLSERRILFAPNVFQVPDAKVERDLVAIMMPFDAEYNPIHNGIKIACKNAGCRCLRVDDIWEESAIIQDIFNLIFKAYIIVVDFTGKNPNVMYETGIAHTLGKHVIPISQSIDDVPFDMKQHRVLKYLPNKEGIEAMVAKLSEKLRQVSK